MTFFLLACTVAALGLYTVGIIASYSHRSKVWVPKNDIEFPPLSLLKPIKGDEEELRENLRSFFEQTYPGPSEIVFASTEENDSGIAVAKAIASEYPDTVSKFVQSDASYGLNPKVANLAGALAATSYDLVLQSDANVRAKPGYLHSIVDEFLHKDASLLTSLVVGVGEENSVAAMENLQLSALVAPSVCTALFVAGVNCVIGKSMLFRRSELESLGGLEQVRDILCEDFILGERYQSAGKTVVLSATTVENINKSITVRQFLSRHSRWLKMRTVIHFGSFVADLFANPVGLATLALLSSGFDKNVSMLLLAIIAYKFLGDSLLLRTMRNVDMKLRHRWVGPFKDVIMVGVWVYSLFSRSVTWRGEKLRFGKRSELRRV